MTRGLAALLAWMLGATAVQAACPPPDAACSVTGGSYFAVTPDSAPRGAMIFLHGWGSSGAGSLRMTGMVESFTARGYVVIAPNGTPREGRGGRRWSFHPDLPSARDEFAFLEAVKADAIARFDLPGEAVLLSGFSVGGSMASYVACFRPDLFAAYAPVGGGMWRPHPEECAGPVRLLHTHGWADGTVPLEGRAVRGADARDPDALVQGDVFETMAIWRQANGCGNHDPDTFSVGDPYWRRVWTECAPGSALELALHPGGHAVPGGWAEMTLDWFEAQLLPN